MDEAEQLKAVAHQNAAATAGARQRADDELIQARDALETRSAELAHSRAMLKATLDCVSDAILVTDRAGRVVTHNARYREIWALPAEPVEWGEQRASLRAVAPCLADPQAFLDRLEEIQATDPPSTFETLGLADGRLIERHSTHQDVAGRTVGRVWSFKDITASTRTEAERESLLSEVHAWNARLEDIFRQAPAFMCVLRGPLHVFEMVNDNYRELVGDRELLGLPVGQAVPEAAVQGFVEHLDGVYASGQTYSAHNASLMVRRVAGHEVEERRLDFVYMPLRDADGTVIGILVHGVDLTERYRAEEATQRLAADLADADRRKTEFIATLAHELRNPLAPIRNGLEFIKRFPADRARVERSQQTMDRQLSHLVRLVDDLMDVARISRGKLELSKQPVSLQSVVAAAVEACAASIDTNGHRLTLALPPQPLVIEADPQRLAQVVTNLLDNAVKYTPPGGRIELRVARHGALAELTVGDRGIGIDPESLVRIFDIFTQVDHEPGGSRGGLGIGLSLVRLIVELHGGQVTATSAGLHEGSVFSVRLPIGDVPPDHAPSSDLPQAAPPTASPSAGVAGGLRVLVVDDNEDAAVTLAALIGLGGHEVRVVHSGAAALKIVEAFCPNVVFLDIGMPGMNGYEVARALRTFGAAPQPMLVALTGWGAESDRRLSAQAGFDLHLTKPIDPAVLDRILERLSQGRSIEAPGA